MAINFQSLLQLKSLWQRFTNQHPKFPAFLRAAQPNSFFDYHTGRKDPRI